MVQKNHCQHYIFHKMTSKMKQLSLENLKYYLSYLYKFLTIQFNNKIQLCVSYEYFVKKECKKLD